MPPSEGRGRWEWALSSRCRRGRISIKIPVGSVWRVPFWMPRGEMSFLVYQDLWQ